MSAGKPKPAGETPAPLVDRTRIQGEMLTNFDPKTTPTSDQNARPAAEAPQKLDDKFGYQGRAINALWRGKIGIGGSRLAEALKCDSMSEALACILGDCKNPETSPSIAHDFLGLLNEVQGFAALVDGKGKK